MDDKSYWKQEYLKDDFDVDKFLSKYIQKIDLETLRKELKKYATTLHTSMSEILKTETEAIVNLAENLTNLNSKVSELSTPIFQLYEEIRALFEIIRTAENSFAEYFYKMKLIKDRQSYLQMKMDLASTSVYVDNIINKQTIDSDDSVAILERAVNEYAFQHICMKIMKMNLTSVDMDEDLNITENNFKFMIDKKFIEAVSSSDEEVIVACLRMYEKLGFQKKCEDLYREKIVEPILGKVFTNTNLENHHHNLNAIYEEALQFLNVDMKILHEVLKKNPDLKSYNFIINSFWKATSKLLEENLPNITAPGNPELFQKRFQNTWIFLQTVANKDNNPDLIFEESFQEHIKRFNLPVYFEIRFQQISCSLETELMNNQDIKTVNKNVCENSQFKMNVTVALWRALNHCFHPQVFLGHLSDQFVKLSMLILSRYLGWLEELVLKSLMENDGLVTFLVHCLYDINILQNCLGGQIKTNIENSIYRILPQKMWPIILQAIAKNEELLANIYDKVQAHLISMVVQECNNILQEVRSIPRLYRRTNKTVPEEKSNYILHVVSLVKKFHDTNESLLKGIISSLMDLCIFKIGEQYLTLVHEVLLSVCKTEESLRRLKNRNLNVNDESSQASNELTSDEAKIRRQIRLDVEYFIEQLSPLADKPAKLEMKSLAEECGFHFNIN